MGAGCPCHNVGAPLVGALGSAMPNGEGRHKACPYVVLQLRKVGSGQPGVLNPKS